MTPSRVAAPAALSTLALTISLTLGGCSAVPGLGRRDADTGTVPVEKVIDGDTIRVRREGRSEAVRLIGIDTPETNAPRQPVQCFAREATARMEELLAGERVRLRTDPTQDERDRYGRLLAYVWRADGLFVNEVMVAEGYAHEYTYDLPYEYQAEFRQAEVAAREDERGLWAPDTCAGDTRRPAP